MDFELGVEAEMVRDQVREFLSEHLTDQLRARILETGSMHDAAFHKSFCERRWFAPDWPEDEGGHGMGPFEVAALREELFRAHAPYFGASTTLIAANTIRRLGTERQRQEILPAMVSGELVSCLGFTEPDAGSDLGAVSIRATQDGDEWVVQGQKMFTTGMEYSDYVFLLARTSRDEHRHQGLTFFLVPVRSGGLTYQPIQTLGGERTNAGFYDDVRVPDELRIGEVGRGWDVLNVALTYERLLAYGGLLDRLMDSADAWARQDASGERFARPDVRRGLGRLAIAAEISNLLCRRLAWLEETGDIDHVDTAVAKLYSTEAFRHLSSEVLDLIGPTACIQRPDERSPVGGTVDESYRFSQIMTIGGGTSEVLRNNIAQRALGLPR